MESDGLNMITKLFIALPMKRQRLLFFNTYLGWLLTLVVEMNVVDLILWASQGTGMFYSCSFGCFCHHVKKSNIEDQVERGLAISVTSDIVTGAQTIRAPCTSQATSLLSLQSLAEELSILPPRKILKYNCCFNLLCSIFVLFWQQIDS